MADNKNYGRKFWNNRYPRHNVVQKPEITIKEEVKKVDVKQTDAEKEILKTLTIIHKLILENISGDIDGGWVRDFVIRGEIPNDLDLFVRNIPETVKLIKLILGMTFNVKCEENDDDYNIDRKGVRIVAEHRTLPSANDPNKKYILSIDINDKAFCTTPPDLDVNCLSLSSQHMTVKNPLSIADLSQIINNIKNKEFVILFKQTKSLISRSNNIKINSDYVMISIKMQARIAKRLNGGWQIHKINNSPTEILKYLRKIFNECVIQYSKDDGMCALCQEEEFGDKFCCELVCCKNKICFSCAHKHIKARYNNSSIECPYCRGDPFGMKTL